MINQEQTVKDILEDSCLEYSGVVYHNYKGDQPEEIDELYFSDLHTASKHQPAKFAILFSFGDYGGWYGDEANIRSWREEFDKGEHVFWWECFGGYGSKGIAIKLDYVPDEDTAWNLDYILSGLHNYPLIDDDALGEVENEAEDDAWENYVQSDLERAMKLDEDADPEPSDHPDELREAFHKAMEQLDEYPFHEAPGSVYYNIDKIAPVCKEIYLELTKEQSA